MTPTRTQAVQWYTYHWTHKPSGETGGRKIVRGAYYAELSARVYTVEQARELVAMWNEKAPDTWRYELVTP